MREQVLDTIRSVGKAGANMLFPNDLEYYAITVELVDSKGDTTDYLTFPVNPDSFMYSDKSLASINKTMGGVTTLNTGSFVPKPITISGTFGRSFKILLRPPLQKNENLSLNLSGSDGLSLETNVFNTTLKSGYGTTKILESILSKSKQLDIFNQPYRLFLYAPLIGHNFLVEYNDFNLKQDFSSSNMMWKYNIQMTAIAPLTDQSNRTQANRLLIASLQKGANAMARLIKKSV